MAASLADLPELCLERIAGALGVWDGDWRTDADALSDLRCLGGTCKALRTLCRRVERKVFADRIEEFQHLQEACVRQANGVMLDIMSKMNDMTEVPDHVLVADTDTMRLLAMEMGIGASGTRPMLLSRIKRWYARNNAYAMATIARMRAQMQMFQKQASNDWNWGVRCLKKHATKCYTRDDARYAFGLMPRDVAPLRVHHFGRMNTCYYERAVMVAAATAKYGGYEGYIAVERRKERRVQERLELKKERAARLDKALAKLGVLQAAKEANAMVPRSPYAAYVNGKGRLPEVARQMAGLAERFVAVSTRAAALGLDMSKRWMKSSVLLGDFLSKGQGDLDAAMGLLQEIRYLRTSRLDFCPCCYERMEGYRIEMRDKLQQRHPKPWLLPDLPRGLLEWYMEREYTARLRGLAKNAVACSACKGHRSQIKAELLRRHATVPLSLSAFLCFDWQGLGDRLRREAQFMRAFM